MTVYMVYSVPIISCWIRRSGVSKNIILIPWRSLHYSFLIGMLMILTLTGCATPKVKMYPGEEVEASKQAVVRVNQRESSRGKLGITKVDGNITVNMFKFLFNGGKWAGEVYVLPGKHRIMARIDYGLSFAGGAMWLIAEPGETYLLKALSNGYAVTMWLENERTGQKVGGIIGSDDEPKE